MTTATLPSVADLLDATLRAGAASARARAAYAPFDQAERAAGDAWLDSPSPDTHAAWFAAIAAARPAFAAVQTARQAFLTACDAHDAAFAALWPEE